MILQGKNCDNFEDTIKILTLVYIYNVIDSITIRLMNHEPLTFSVQ